MTWTSADGAELDCLVHELTRGYFEHRALCDRCAAWTERRPDSTPCPHVGNAVDTVIEWRRACRLLSRAEALRIERKVQVAA